MLRVFDQFLIVIFVLGLSSRDLVQHAIKNIGRKVLNLNDITLNKQFGNLIGRSFEMPYVSYCHLLCVMPADYLTFQQFLDFLYICV
jgi:hypothetical protein